MSAAALRWSRRTNADGDRYDGLVATSGGHRFEIHGDYPSGWHLDVYDDPTSARPVLRIETDLMGTARSEAIRLAADPSALARAVADRSAPPDPEVLCLTSTDAATCPYALGVGRGVCLSGCWSEPCGGPEPLTNGYGAPVADDGLDERLRATVTRWSDQAHERRAHLTP